MTWAGEEGWGAGRTWGGALVISAVLLGWDLGPAQPSPSPSGHLFVQRQDCTEASPGPYTCRPFEWPEEASLGPQQRAGLRTWVWGPMASIFFWRILGVGQVLPVSQAESLVRVGWREKGGSLLCGLPLGRDMEAQPSAWHTFGPLVPASPPIPMVAGLVLPAPVRPVRQARPPSPDCAFPPLGLPPPACLSPARAVGTSPRPVTGQWPSCLTTPSPLSLLFEQPGTVPYGCLVSSCLRKVGVGKEER